MDQTRSRGDRYALSALVKRRAIIASEIVQLERQLKHRRESLIHVDATLRLLDPTIRTASIPNKRVTKRVKLFRQGELGRLILDAIRKAPEGSVTTHDIVTALLAFGGHGEAARSAVAGRVRGNLAYLQRRGMVEKSGSMRESRWSLRQS